MAALSEIAGAVVHDGADGQKMVADVAPLDQAGADDLSFLDNKRYTDAFSQSAAGACVIRPDLADRAPQGMHLLLSDDPYAAYARIAQAFYPEPEATGRISPAAHVDPTADIGAASEVGPGAVVEAGASIGARCIIGPNVVIGRNVVMGEDCTIHAGASLSHCLLGDRCVIQSGARVGDQGFGFAPNPDGFVSVPQIGRVLIGNDVNIGSNSTVDRGAGPDTVIGDGCRIDNLVQIGHNVVMGRGCIIVGQAGVSGSSILEDFVIVAGKSGIAGHLTIGRGAKIAGGSGVMRDVPPGAQVMGIPAIPIKRHLRQLTVLAKLADKKGD